MAKVTRDTLARGTELLTEHVFKPMEDIAAQLSGNIVSEQLQEPYSTFRLNLNIPYISSRFFRANPGGWYYIPFCLPPLQEDFDGYAAIEPGTPTPVLTEVSFSFDQRGEPAMIYDAIGGRAEPINPDDRFVPAIAEGWPCYDRAAAVDIKLAIFEKSQHFYSGQVAGGGADSLATFAPGPDSEVFSMKIGGAALATSAYRANPEVVPGEAEGRDLNISIDPTKTYIVALNADGLVSTTSDAIHLALVSVQISLGFKMRLVERDVSSDTVAPDHPLVQNIPTVSEGARTNASVTIASPSAGHVVQADTQDGVSTNLEKIDSEFRRKIYGGYYDFSSAHVKQHIKEDAGYEVIAVPLFNNQALGEILARPCWKHVRDDFGYYCDRAIVPITSPMTIHHVLVTNNFTTATSNIYGGFDEAPPWVIGTDRYVTVPDPSPHDSSITYQVGVGIVSGAQSDTVNYQQVAYVDFAPDAANSAYLVDFMDLRNRASHHKPYTHFDPDPIDFHPAHAHETHRPQRWEQAIFSVPLVSSDLTGYGYHNSDNIPYRNGRPFFVGEAARGGLDTNARTPVGTIAGGSAASAASGTEQLLEIRMKITPANEPFPWDAAGDPPQSTWSGTSRNWDIFSGYGGSWVYIIGKKHMRM